MGETGSNKKVANSLVALSSAAVLAVYSAGYQRTKAAADRFERQAASRRHSAPAPAAAEPATAPVGAIPSGARPGGAPALPAGPGVRAAVATPAPKPTAALGSQSSTPGDALPLAGGGENPVPAAPTEAPAAGPAIPLVPAAEPQSAANAAPPEVAPAAPPLPRGRFKDGTYLGWGSCRHGDIQAQVVVQGGRITQATISSCETRYSCDWLDPILPQVAVRQSAFVDSVSGATDSTDAFSAAVTDALSKAQ